MIQFCVDKVDELNRSNELGTSMGLSYEDDMVLNPSLYVISAITCGGWKSTGESCLLLYLNYFKHCLYEGTTLQELWVVTEMV